MISLLPLYSTVNNPGLHKYYPFWLFFAWPPKAVILGRINLYPYAILIIATTHPEIGKQRRREAETRSMITQIEIDGFKTFKDFKLELAPFRVIVGPNGSGKSNLFDALQLLSQFLIPGNDGYKAMQGIRGEAGELFTKYPDGSTSDAIRIAVEILADRKESLTDGREIDLKFARFRYELEIRSEQNKNKEYQNILKEIDYLVYHHYRIAGVRDIIFYLISIKYSKIWI